MDIFLRLYFPLLLFVGISVVFFIWDTPVLYGMQFLEDSSYLAYVVFVLLLVGAVVFMPIAILPVIPLVAPILGPFVTGVLSVIGWTIGSMVAFLISRHLGRPFLEKFVSLHKLDILAEQLPSDVRFYAIVSLRVVIPVDILSYALGLVRGIRFWHYTLATAIGVTWFSFAFAYLGDALFEGSVRGIGIVMGTSLLVFFGAWYMLLRERNRQKKD